MQVGGHGSFDLMQLPIAGEHDADAGLNVSCLIAVTERFGATLLVSQNSIVRRGVWRPYAGFRPPSP